MNEAEVTECFKDEKGPFKNVHQIADTEGGIKKMLKLLESVDLNLYEYIYMRRFQNAMNNCAENDRIQPNRIYCAI